MCLVLGVLAIGGAVSGLKVEFKHHNNSEVEAVLRGVASECADVTHLYSIGTTPRGNKLWVLAMSDSPAVHEVGEPEFKYVANMHGNEVVGREMLLHFANYLCEQYRSGATEVVSLVNSMRIHLMPTMNPDGWAMGAQLRGQVSNEADAGSMWKVGRENAAGVDLNRNFPDLDGFEFSQQAELGVSLRTPEYDSVREVVLEKVSSLLVVLKLRGRLKAKLMSLLIGRTERPGSVCSPHSFTKVMLPAAVCVSW